MKIKVIASKPADNGQCGIENLIGKIYTVRNKDNETGEVEIYSTEFDGQIQLNKGEYRRLHRKG